jgi:hypothetical protein
VGITIFQGQQYSSCSKAGGCRAAQMLGGFRGNLLIISWVTPTPGCTANFPGNCCCQPRIMCAFGRSGQVDQELPVEYQVETLAKATISQQQYPYQNHKKITQ